MKKKFQRVVIVAAGTLHKKFLDDISKHDFVIGVDRGALWLIRHEKVPEVALGDFDSVNKSELQEIKARVKHVEEYPSQKDKTDLELAVDESIKLRPKEVVIYGAIGTRFDHTFAAIGLLLKLESHNIYGQIVDNFNKIHIVRRQETISTSVYRYISVLPLTNRATITLTGFVYNATRLTLPRTSTRGISNEIKDAQAIISVHTGRVLVIWSSDSGTMGVF
ncbi:thiamine diphosphokinase [Candidatus Gottesmanbacteria bacterium]|nr:thiamine diphosphokinase [Candidatus Gottesmanbacteria bacterium]